MMIHWINHALGILSIAAFYLVPAGLAVFMLAVVAYSIISRKDQKQ